MSVFPSRSAIWRLPERTVLADRDLSALMKFNRAQLEQSEPHVIAAQDMSEALEDKLREICDELWPELIGHIVVEIKHRVHDMYFEVCVLHPALPRHLSAGSRGRTVVRNSDGTMGFVETATTRDDPSLTVPVLVVNPSQARHGSIVWWLPRDRQMITTMSGEMRIHRIWRDAHVSLRGIREELRVAAPSSMDPDQIMELLRHDPELREHSERMWREIQ